MKIDVMHDMLSESLGGVVSDVKPIDKREPNQKLWYGFIVLFFLAIIVFNSIFAVVRVSGHSMDATLSDGQFVVVNKHRQVRRFDIVVLKERLTEGGETKQIIKRVIGLPGDSIVVENGKLYINNVLHEESYLTDALTENYRTQSYAIIVPEDAYFVLGDNRDVSKDSRMVGSFVKTSVLGSMETPQSEKGE